MSGKREKKRRGMENAEKRLCIFQKAGISDRAIQEERGFMELFIWKEGRRSTK
ncbi:MAG: hypothetical protein HFF83_11510 [Oscillibacter sp.]|jgi:hypothetical protein|nr:hypothetical protein [Oscillibacter sp.]